MILEYGVCAAQTQEQKMEREIMSMFLAWLEKQREASPFDAKNTSDFQYLTFTELPPFTAQHRHVPPHCSTRMQDGSWSWSLLPVRHRERSRCVCVCVCVRACVRACVHACVCVCLCACGRVLGGRQVGASVHHVAGEQGRYPADSACILAARSSLVVETRGAVLEAHN